MIKSSVKVKYVNTCHPDKRDGLLKANLEKLADGESLFHNNIFTYYQNRPVMELVEEIESHTWEDFKIKSWDEMCLADFVSCYDIIYGKKNLMKQKTSRKECYPIM